MEKKVRKGLLIWSGINQFVGYGWLLYLDWKIAVSVFLIHWGQNMYNEMMYKKDLRDNETKEI